MKHANANAGKPATGARRSPFALLSDLYLALLVTLFVLWPGGEGYAAIRETKTRCFYWLAGGYLAALAVLYGEMRLTGQLSRLKPGKLLQKSSWPQRLVAVYGLLAALSTALSPYRAQALLGMSRGEGLVTIVLYCLTFLCLSALARPGEWLAWLLAGSMTVLDGICLLQLRGGNPLGLFPQGLTFFDGGWKYSGLFLGTCGNAGLTTAVLCLSFPLLLHLARQGKRPFRLLSLIPAGMNLAVVLQSTVQGAQVGLALGLLLSLPVLAGEGRRRRLARVLVVAVLAGALCLVLFAPGESGLPYQLNQLLHGNFDPQFGNGRVFIWQEVLSRVPEDLWLGKGPDTMAAFGLEPMQWSPAEGQTVTLHIDIAHNDYLNILFHQGLPALAVYLAALVLTAARWRKTCRPQTAFLGAGVLCYCIQVFFGYGMNAAAALFWAAWALLEKEIREQEETSCENGKSC